MEHGDTTCDRQSLSPDAEEIFCGGLIHGQQPSADAGVKMRQSELALVSSGTDILCSDLTSALVGKWQTLPFKTQGCQHLPFAVRKTWEKKEDIAIHCVACIKYLAKGLALAVSI